MIERKFDFRSFVLSLCYGKDETCTRAQIMNYVTGRIDAFSLVVDEKLLGKSDVGHKHVKADVSDLKNATTTEAGLMSIADKKKLDGVSEGANKITVESTWKPDSTNPVQSCVIADTFYDKAKIVELLSNIETGRGKLLSIYLDEATGDLIVDDDSFDYYTMDEVDELFTVEVEKQATPDSGFLSTYVVKQGGSPVGSKINIPKDFLVKSASVKTCTVDNNPVSGIVKGDKYIDFIINARDGSGSDEHLYLNVKDLVDVYTADESTLTLTGNKFSLKNVPVDKITGLSKVATSGVYDDLTGKPTIPSKTSQLTNDSNFLTSHQSLTDYVQKSSTVGLLKNDGSVDTTSYATSQALSGKVDKVSGKGLSSNDFTDTLKNQLENITSNTDDEVHRNSPGLISSDGVYTTLKRFNLIKKITFNDLWYGVNREYPDSSDLFSLENQAVQTGNLSDLIHRAINRRLLDLFNHDVTSEEYPHVLLILVTQYFGEFLFLINDDGMVVSFDRERQFIKNYYMPSTHIDELFLSDGSNSLLEAITSTTFWEKFLVYLRNSIYEELNTLCDYIVHIGEYRFLVNVPYDKKEISRDNIVFLDEWKINQLNVNVNFTDDSCKSFKLYGEEIVNASNGE